MCGRSTKTRLRRMVINQLRLLVSKNGVYLSRGHNDVTQSTLNNINGDYLPRGQSTTAVTTHGGYHSHGQVKMETIFPVVNYNMKTTFPVVK